MGTRPFILNIYKPSGISSFDVIRIIKSRFKKKWKKIGHFGTLDPFAEGVLLIGANGAMKINDYLHEAYFKTYEAFGVIGVKTDTGDLEGQVLKENSKLEVSKFLDLKFEDVKRSLEEKFQGEYLQVPPSFSATKYNGKKLYEYARCGIHIEKPAVKRAIKELMINKIEARHLLFEASVSTGTYIRVLYEDMMNSFSLNGHLFKLKRSKIGPFLSDDALTLDQLKDLSEAELVEKSYHIDKVLNFNTLVFTDEGAEKKYLNGVKLDQSSLDGYVKLNEIEAFNKDQSVHGIFLNTVLWCYGTKGNLLGLGRFDNGVLRVIFSLSS